MSLRGRRSPWDGIPCFGPRGFSGATRPPLHSPMYSPLPQVSQVVALFLYWPLPQVVQVVSSFVFSLFFPAAHLCVVPHAVFLAEQAVLPLLYWPSEHVVQVVSSYVFTLSFPALNASPAPQDVRFLTQVLLSV